MPPSSSPAFVDLQVNGYAGVDFNSPSPLSPDSLHLACSALQRDGVDSFLLTLITDQIPSLTARLTHLARLRELDPLARRLIAGFHVEGPFINPAEGFRGAHPADAVISADLDSTKRLLDAAPGLVRLVTLAPETDTDLNVTRYLASQSILIAAGHTDASRDKLLAAIDAGLTLFTHLGNGCPATLHRHDNIIHRVLSLADRLHVTLIADGLHLPAWLLAFFIRTIGWERCIVVTDAMAAAAAPPGRHPVGRHTLHVGPDRVARLPGSPYLAGSTLTMGQAWHLLTQTLGLPAQTAEQLTGGNARRLLGG